MSSTQASFPRSPLVDAAFSSMLNSANASSSPSRSATASMTNPDSLLNNGYPAKSASSSLRPPPSDKAASTSPSSAAAMAVAAARMSSSFQRNPRPLSEVIRPESYASPEAEALRDLQEYERNLNNMASTTLDTWFKDDLEHVNKWFASLNDVERTATVYSLLQCLNRVQIRFFSTVLQQMGKTDPVGNLLSPAHPDVSDMMQSQLANAMSKVELEASQKFLSVLPHGHNNNNRAMGRHNPDRHSYAIGEADDPASLFGGGANLNSDFLSNRPASMSFGMSVDEMMARSQQQQQQQQPVFRGSAARPKSVIEGDLSSIFGSGGWPFAAGGGGQRGGMVGIDAHRTSTGRPKSADISHWSLLGGTTGEPPENASHPWGGLSPTRSTFSEHGKTIERPSSASDIDQVFSAANWGISGGSGRGGGNTGNSRNVMLNDDPTRFTRSRRPPSIAGSATIPETDENQQQVADIVLSMYNNNPMPQKSTSTHSFGGTVGNVKPPSRPGSRAASPAPTASSSAGYWDRSSRQANYGRFLNPNDLVPDTAGSHEHDYLSDDHSESSHVSGRGHRQQQQRQGGGSGGGAFNGARKKLFGQRGTSKEKRYSDGVDMQLLEDIPAWLRSLRLHKYNSNFETTKWQDMIKMDDDALSAKGVAALGARRKMLKVFEQVKEHCDKNNIPY